MARIRVKGRVVPQPGCNNPCNPSHPSKSAFRRCIPAAFLDRDGTINAEVNYLTRVQDFRLLPGAAAAVRRLNAAGVAVVVVTNQSVIARGLLTPAGLEEIHARLRADLAAEGAWVDAIYVCPHLPGDGCACRKPAPGLFHQAAADLDLDLARSVIIGDKFSDLLPAQELGCRTVLVLSGHGHAEWQSGGPFTPDAVAPDLGAAVEWWLASGL